MQINTNTIQLPNDHIINEMKESSSVKKLDEHLSKKVNSLALPLFKECLVGLLLNFGAMTFYVTPISVPTLTIGVITSLGLFCLSNLGDSYAGTSTSQRTVFLHKATQLILRTSIVNTIGLGFFNIIIHEYGHFLAANALFLKSNAKIWITPFLGGSTNYIASNRLTFLGKIFGKSSSKAIIAGSGLAASTLYVSVELATAHQLRKKHPNISQYMNLHACTYLFHEVIYGLTALIASKKDIGHDLVRLWTVNGIHPAFPICLMAAIPLIELCWLKMNFK